MNESDSQPREEMEFLGKVQLRSVAMLLPHVCIILLESLLHDWYTRLLITVYPAVCLCLGLLTLDFVLA